MSAFEHGLALGVDGVECDVQLSRDGVPVVIHDATLERTTSGQGPVASHTAAELARVDAAYYYYDTDGAHPFRGQGIGVPTLEEVLSRCRDVRIIVEMKSAEPELARAIVGTIRSAHARDRVCVGSFHQRALDLVRRLEPDLATSASVNETRWTLYRSWVRWPLPPPRRYVAFQVPERAGGLTVVSPRFVRQVHQEGQVVQPWVIDCPDDCRRLLAWGVDGLISDRPDIAIAVRNEFVSASSAKAKASALRTEAERQVSKSSSLKPEA
jgi:glycerophosphoryl diester phosphodiesterase